MLAKNIYSEKNTGSRRVDGALAIPVKKMYLTVRMDDVRDTLHHQAESLRKELDAVKEKARAYLKNLTEVIDVPMLLLFVCVAEVEKRRLRRKSNCILGVWKSAVSLSTVGFHCLVSHFVFFSNEYNHCSLSDVLSRRWELNNGKKQK